MDCILHYLTVSLQEQDVYWSHHIGQKEGYLLQLISIAHLTNKTLRVSDLLSKSDLGSGPTVQSYINKLVYKEYVMRKVSEEDKRIVYLIPTENAMNLFRELSNWLHSEKSVEGQ